MSERRVSDVTEFPEIPSVPELLSWYSKLNGRISFGSRPNAWSGHLDGEWLDVFVPAANVDFPVAHHLGRVPFAWFVADGGDLTRLASTPANNASQVWLRSTSPAGSLFRILVV